MNDKSMASGTSAAARCAARADHRGVSRIDPVSATAYIAEMALHDILILPDKRLRQVSGPVKKIDAGVRKLVEDMFETMYEEGCLSIPEYFDDVERPVQVRVKYLDLEGKLQEVEANGLFATCLQHEIDHLNGILFIDHLSKLKRERVLKKFTKAAKRAAAV